jgi:hypothetical protein
MDRSKPGRTYRGYALRSIKNDLVLGWDGSASRGNKKAKTKAPRNRKRRKDES